MGTEVQVRCPPRGRARRSHRARQKIRQRRVGRVRERRAQPSRRKPRSPRQRSLTRTTVELRFVTPELRRLDDTGSEVLACGIFEDERPVRGTAGLLDWRLAGQISRLMQTGFVVGTKGEVVMFPLRPKLPFDKALMFGLGRREQ